MRFASHVLLLQLATVSAVVVVCATACAWLGIQQLRDDAGSTALAVARTVAVDQEVRATLAARSDGLLPADDENRQTRVRVIAEEVRQRTGALFVVLIDTEGTRLTHPDPRRIGLPTSTDYTAALGGTERVVWEIGTLGESARGKVPVFAPGSTRAVGVVSVGFAPSTVFARLPVVYFAVGAAAILALAIGVIASVLLRRRLARLTLGLQPEEFATLVHDRAAVLDGVGEGVLAVDTRGRVTVCNGRAAALLGVRDALGAPVGSLGLPAALAQMLAPVRGRTGEALELMLGGRALYIDVRAVERGGRCLGFVAVVRDRTDLVSLTQRLGAVSATMDALRAQRHEFANRVHVVGGLIDAGRTVEARRFLIELAARGPVKFPVEHAERVAEPFLQAFIGAKGEEASERGVRLIVGPETFVRGGVTEPEDVATVLGNLIDNAVHAAAEGSHPRWVEIELLDDGDALYASIGDSGAGMADVETAFDSPVGAATASGRADALHGGGFGLPLSRDVARRRGGEVWVVDPGGATHGAVFCTRLPGVLGEVHT